MRRMRLTKGAVLVLAALLAWASAGCYGRFQLTRAVHEKNGAVENQYLRSAVTWLLVIVPVYEAAALLDLVVFNVIEFWNGENPISAAPSEKVVASGGDRAVMTVSRDGEGTVATIRTFRDDDPVATVIVRDNGRGEVTASRVEGGRVTAASRAHIRPDGSVAVAAAPSAPPDGAPGDDRGTR